MSTQALWVFSAQKTPKHACPVCQRNLNAVTPISEEQARPQPVVGDTTICAYCHTVCIFESATQLRVATTEECEALPPWAKALAGFV